MNKGYLVVFCTVPDAAVAKKISRKLVEEKLAACCNIIPGLTSIYYWEDRIQEDSELLLIIKTREDGFQNIEKRILELHPYEIPEIIAVPIKNGNLNYLKWVDKNVK